MPHPSKVARKARNRKQVAVQANVLHLQNVIAKQNTSINILVEQYLKEQAQRAHLSKVLAFMVAAQGGGYEINGEAFAKFPLTAKLQEMVSGETHDITLMTTLDEDTEAEQPAVEVITPKIEVASR